MADSGRLQGWRGLEPLLARQHSVSVGPCLGSLDHSVQIHIQEAAPFLKMSLEFCSSYGELPLDLMKSRCLSSCWPKVVAWEGWGVGNFLSRAAQVWDKPPRVACYSVSEEEQRTPLWPPLSTPAPRVALSPQPTENRDPPGVSGHHPAGSTSESLPVPRDRGQSPLPLEHRLPFCRSALPRGQSPTGTKTVEAQLITERHPGDC